MGVFKDGKRFTRLNRGREHVGWRSQGWDQPGVCLEMFQVKLSFQWEAGNGRKNEAGAAGAMKAFWRRAGSDLRPMHWKGDLCHTLCESRPT